MNRDNKGRFAKTKVFFRKLITYSFIAGLIWGAFQLGSNFYGETVYAEKEVKVEVPVKAPVLERIAKCESGNKQFKSDGSLVINNNSNGSKDVGVFQINVNVWGLKAMELEYNLTKEKDNRAFAQYLYENFGTEPWVHSKSCWNK